MEELKRVISKWASKDSEIYKVHIFGSRAKGNSRGDSDVDVAIEFKPKFNNLANWIQRAKEMRESLQPALLCKLDLQWYGGSKETEIIHKGLQAGHCTIYEANI